MNRFTTRATVLALVLLLAIGGAAFGQSLAIETGATYALGALDQVRYDPNLEITFSGDVGDYNSYKVTLQDAGNTNTSTGFPTGDLAEDLVQINEAYWSTDLLGSLGVMGMPLAATLTVGFDAYNTAGYGVVTKKEEEGVFSAEFESAAVDVDLLISDQIGIETALDLGLEAFFIGGTINISPVQAEVVYSVDTGETSATADIGGGVEAALPLGGIDLAVGGELNYDLDTTNANPLDWGAGVRADLGVAGLGASVGTTGGAINVAAIEANASLMDGVSVEAYVGLALATGVPATDLLDLVEVTLILGDGSPFQWWIGFAMVGAQNATGDKNAPGAPAAGDSSIYFKAKLKV